MIVPDGRGSLVVGFSHAEKFSGKLFAVQERCGGVVVGARLEGNERKAAIVAIESRCRVRHPQARILNPGLAQEVLEGRFGYFAVDVCDEKFKHVVSPRVDLLPGRCARLRPVMPGMNVLTV